MFFGYNFPKPERICMQSGIEVWDHSAHLHKKLWEIAPGIPPNGAKTCFFLSLIQCGLLDTYPALMLTMFETVDMNRCAGAYTGEKFPNFCVEVLQASKNCSQKQYFG